MMQNAAFHQGLHCLPKNLLNSFLVCKGLKVNLVYEMEILSLMLCKIMNRENILKSHIQILMKNQHVEINQMQISMH